MTKWEYMVRFVWDNEYESASSAINLAGNEGWELVSAVHVPGDDPKTDLYFKRPFPPESITFDNVVSCTSSYTPVDIYAPPVVIAFAEVKEINEG